ncbi:hypothetical protein Daus18300_001759 [Diaporthe australafricana]|uniref:Uncharacterized protein n=1 Tax=Diaporthe australafricana TaxID=127596 RepID=A0ABR3XTY6_9PEZI
MKTTRRPIALISLLWALFSLTLFAFLQTAESRAVSNDGPSSVSHLGPRAEDAPSLYLDDTGGWNATAAAENDLLVPRGDIEKRTLQYTKNGKKFSFSEIDYPTTQQLKDELFVGDKKAVLDGGVNIQYFYTGLGGRGSIGIIKNYLKCDAARALFPDQRAVGYPDVVTVQGFMSATTAALNSASKKGSLLVPRIASQALGEECSGRVFIFTRGDKEPGWDWKNPNDNTWVGWEFPALTRNPAVTDIVKIDPRPGEDHTPLIIWKREWGPSANEPRGADESVTDDRN